MELFLSFFFDHTNNWTFVAIFCVFLLVYCFFEETKVLDDKGEVHLEKIATHIDKLDMEIQEIAMNMGKKCLNPQGDTQCDRAFWFHKCWKTADPRVSHPILLFIAMGIFGNFMGLLFFSALLFGLSIPHLINIIPLIQAFPID